MSGPRRAEPFGLRAWRKGARRAYAGGTRVFDISGGTIKEVAAHIDTDGSNVWGVQVFSQDGKEYVAASDRDYGVQIFEYTPVNKKP